MHERTNGIIREQTASHQTLPAPLCSPEISTLNGVPGKCLAAYRQPLAVVQQQRSPALGPAMAVVQTANEALVVASWILDHMAASGG